MENWEKVLCQSVVVIWKKIMKKQNLSSINITPVKPLPNTPTNFVSYFTKMKNLKIFALKKVSFKV
jgi:hypothetical protein